eukprot:CAMPEP_0174310072 /NCGR_PEP_ID=MMETSP0810-20121108/2817_1 /TAXON_ID=73025 ORGANISM="Eutreptiella gymnastica-like, Strain CCMP1594" /NCGR_SAMPLE_ID=MMETSP0810 /ASSEMBLY_ACC=CAM_ASM_000659 /LENGTH=48 /DNA_ID= /DNA_START= /DNA_END= /DNA_ORIENTATION=
MSFTNMYPTRPYGTAPRLMATAENSMPRRPVRVLQQRNFPSVSLVAAP